MTMSGLQREGGTAVGGGTYRFRVSDAARVPLRGYLLRLRLMDGRPSLSKLRPGSRILLRSPDGVERVVEVQDFSVIGGRATQQRLERTGELDVLISETDAVRDGRAVEIGWQVLEPSAGGRAA